MKKHETVSLNRGLRIALLASLILSAMIGVLPYSSLAAPAAAAVGTTYIVTSTSCTGPGSIVEAIAAANANPGEDTIQLVPGLQIDATTCPPISTIYFRNYVIAAVTDSLIIEGNGGALTGNMFWVNQSGNQSFAFCPNRQPGTLVTGAMPGFLRIGETGQDNPGLQVTIKNLRVQLFNQVAAVYPEASLVMEDVYMKDIFAWRECNTPAIDAFEGASVTLRRTTFENYNSFENVSFGASPAMGAISGGRGSGAGDLTIEDSLFFSIDAGYPQNTIWWDGAPGSKVNIVSTLFGRSGREDSPYFGKVGGIYVGGHAETNIVNSLWNNDIFGEVNIGDQIMNSSSGDMNIIASTLIWNTDQCDPRRCSDPNATPSLISRIGTGRIHFKQSAIGLNFVSTPPATSLLTLNDIGTNGFTADADTWIQPTQRQISTTLSTITAQPLLRTDPPAFDIPYTGFWSTALGMPSLGTSGNPGQLNGKILNSNCGNTNELINPIDGTTCIDKDVLGNARWDTSNNRNIGALQLAQAPQLKVVAVGDGSVELNWTHSAEPPSGPITGYVLAYREKGTSTWSTVNISGAGTLAYKVTGLTNGVEYEFQVEGTVSTGPSGYPSNIVTGIPLGPIGTPVVTATPGNGQVDLSWTKPSDGGHVIDAYSILWRPTGTTSWIGAKGVFGTAGAPPATQTTITGLTNGTAYEFAVTANAADGEISSQGLATGTPYVPGTVIIHKQKAPTGPIPQGFVFTQDIDGSGVFPLDGYSFRTKVFNSVAPGSYEVTENDPQGLGYELTNITCVDGDSNGVTSTVDVATRTATINVDSGETVQCTFNNAQEETVVIEKRTVPPGGSGFTFSDDIGTPNSFSLNDAETRTFTHVPQGSYQATEGAMPGYELTAINCTVEGVNVPGDLASRTANISLQQPGGSAHCTFTNTKLGILILRKETLPDGATEAFDYTISGPDTSDSGSLVDGAFTQVDNAKPGTWELTESLPAVDWHLGDISCTSTLGTSTLTEDIDNLKATVELAPGDTMDCTFTNVEDDTITMEKVTVPAGDTTTTFAFTGSGSIGGFALKDGESQSFSVDAAAAPFTLTEGDPSGAGYEVTEIRCVDSKTGGVTLGDPGTRSVDLDTQPGESQHCTFTNERHGQVVIRKATAPAGDTANSFDFYGSFPSFSLKDGENQTFLDVAPGAYSVSEVDPSGLGYGLSGIRCSDSDPNGTPSTVDLATHTAGINVDAGETVECTFTNSELDSISVLKVTLPPGGTGFGFGGDFGSFTLDDGGLTTFDNVVPGTYTISEDDPTPDYDLALILCHDAATGEFFEGDVANRQVDLDLEAGHQVLCEFVNVQRGTIIIEKAPGSGTGYNFNGDLGDFTLDSGQEQTFINQPVGEYTVSEQTPPGDVLTGLTCTDSDANGVASTGDVAANTATINLDPGETVRCTYTNQPGGSIVIKKTAASGPSGPFTFLDNIQTPATFELSDGGEQRFDGILPGTYTVQETAFPDGSGLAEIDCVDSDANGTPSDDDMRSKTAIIHLDPGETVECTFTNEWLNRIYLPIIFR